METANGKLGQLFELARKEQIVARQNYWCCSTCGCEGVRQVTEKLQAKGLPVEGYVFYHKQDTEHAWGKRSGNGWLALRYGVAGGENEEGRTAAVGVRIVELARKVGLETMWNGNPSTVIFVRVGAEDRPTKKVGRART